MWEGGHFSVFIVETFHYFPFFKTKLLTIIQKFVKVRKSVKIEVKYKHNEI